MFGYEKECFTEKEAEKVKEKDFKHNEYICETAGFIPLEVKFKKFEQAGIRAQISGADYTSSDYRDMYLNPDYQVYPDDEIEEVEEKFRALHIHIDEVKKKAQLREAAKSNGNNVQAGTEEPKKSTEKKSADAD